LKKKSTGGRATTESNDNQEQQNGRSALHLVHALQFTVQLPRSGSEFIDAAHKAGVWAERICWQ